LIKKNLKTIIITSVLTILPLIYGLLIWDKLPDTIATHFGISGNPDGFSSKTFTVLGLPGILFGGHLICLVATFADPKIDNVTNKIVKLVFWIMPIISNITMLCIYLVALGKPVNISVILTIMIGLMFIVVGNYMPKCRPNYTIGIKIPWTLNDEENWVKTHRFAGILWVIAGFLVIICAIINKPIIMLPIVFVVSFVPMIYSYIYYIKHK